MEGFRTAIEAFGILRADAHLENPAAQSLVATETVLVDELARELGHPGAARDDLAVALKICEDVSKAVPRIRPQLKQYIDWYRYRLAELNPDVVH